MTVGNRLRACRLCDHAA